jgi:hypothetical protein
MASSEREPGEVDHRALVREAVRGEGFVRLAVQGARAGETVPWVKVVVRPVEVRGKRWLQFSHFDGRKDTTRNYHGEEGAQKLDELLALPFRQFHVETTGGAVHIRITKRGRALVQREAAREEPAPEALAHDHVKEQPLPLTRPDVFLQGLGVMNVAGGIRPGLQAKYRQINEFLRLLDSALGHLPPEAEGPLEIVDCGSGSAYLTFAAYHYLMHVRGRQARVTGIDSDPEAVAKSVRLRNALGWEGMAFHLGQIAEFTPVRRPHIVLSLHACDTATDEAIALGVRSGSEVILAAPCCQHELSGQLQAPLFRPVLRHGVLRQRLADLLADTFRALALRLMGYRTDVVEFVSPEHTAKNLMIRALRAGLPAPPQLVREYRQLRDFWQVRPSIEALLGDDLAARLGIDRATTP